MAAPFDILYVASEGWIRQDGLDSDWTSPRDICLIDRWDPGVDI